MPSLPWKPVMRQYSTKNPYCGCPLDYPFSKCYHCTTPDTLEVRILYPPTKCVKQPCDFTIPAVDCREEMKRKPVERYSYDLTVDEPGPNDSYGLNGLNWHDWSLDEHNKVRRAQLDESNVSIPNHPCNKAMEAVTFDWWRCGPAGRIIKVPKPQPLPLPPPWPAMPNYDLCWPLMKTPVKHNIFDKRKKSDDDDDCEISEDFWPDKWDRSGSRGRLKHVRQNWTPATLCSDCGVVRHAPPYKRYCRERDKPIQSSICKISNNDGCK